MLDVNNSRKAESVGEKKRALKKWKTMSDCSPIGLATGIMPTYNTWNFCTISVFGVGNSAKGNTQHTH